VLAGDNDLATKFPEIANEADGWNPSTVTAGSTKKLPWKCSKGHIWSATVSSRTGDSTGCPVCAGKQVLAGDNDLATKFPEIANEADGWNPSTVTAGSNKKLKWKCSKGHIWSATVSHRTHKTDPRGCPVCAGRQVLFGYNDLATKFPEIANEADGWNPSTVTAGSTKKLPWKCSKGHRWSAAVNNRTTNSVGCPVCAGRQVLAGDNDLATTHPEIANEAVDYELTKTVTAGSHKKLQWKCSKGHRWSAQVNSRTGSSSGCPVCAGKQVLAGDNDLATKFPEIAKEADGWEPSTVMAGSNKKLKWKCSKGHIWSAAVYSRTYKTDPAGCPVCSGHQVLAGDNDLATTHPKLANEAVDYELTKTVTAGSNKKLKWKCSKGHRWSATVSSRTHKTDPRGCPVCADYGFSPEKPAWLYLMERHGEQQFGITNVPQTRMRTHKRNRWKSLDWHGPALGTIVFQRERQLKQWLKKTHGTITGTTENWSTDKYFPKTLRKLCCDAGVDLTEIPRDESLMQKGLFRRKND